MRTTPAPNPGRLMVLVRTHVIVLAIHPVFTGDGRRTKQREQRGVLIRLDRDGLKAVPRFVRFVCA